MDIVGLATYAMDVMMKVDTLPGEDGFAVVSSNTYVPGGSGTNVIVQAARLGAECGFMALVGEDTLGKDIIDSLKDEQVDTSEIKKKKKGISLHTDIVVDKEGKKFILLNMGDSFLDYQENDVCENYIKKAEVYYTDLLPIGPAMKGLKTAKAAGKKTAFNMQVNVSVMEGFGASEKMILESLQYVDLFAPCRDGLYMLCGTDNLENCLQYLRPYFKGTLLITLGGEGSVAFDESNRKYTQPISKMKPVDTTGAGDSYMGGMLYSYLLKNMPLQEAMEFSTICAAVTCSSLGARSGPGLAEVQKLRNSR